MGLFKKIGKSIKKVGQAAISASDPRALLNPKEKFKADMNVFTEALSSANENSMLTNPLNKNLKRFNLKGKKAGGIGRYLGGFGETTRKKPVEISLAFWGAAAGVNQLLSKGADSLAAHAGASATGAGSSIASTGTGLISGSSAAGLVADILTGDKGNKNPESVPEGSPAGIAKAGLFSGSNFFVLSSLAGAVVYAFDLTKGRK